MKSFRSFLSDKTVEKKYVKAGANFGYLASYIYMGEALQTVSFLKKWEKWEDEYASRGYKTISLNAFIELGGYGKSIDDLIGQKRDKLEEAVLHAQIYRENYLGKVKPVIDVKKIMEDGEPQFGTYLTPSTEK